MSEEVNAVDVSEATVNSEWSRIAEQHDVVESSQTTGKSNLNFDGVEGVEFSETSDAKQPEKAGATSEEKIAIAQMMINSALVMLVDVLVGVEVPNEKYDRISYAWAVVICKRYKGGILEFLGRYREELTAVGATLVFVKAVREGYAVKKAKDVSPKNKEQPEDSEKSSGVKT